MRNSLVYIGFKIPSGYVDTYGIESSTVLYSAQKKFSSYLAPSFVRSNGKSVSSNEYRSKRMPQNLIRSFYVLSIVQFISFCLTNIV